MTYREQQRPSDIVDALEAIRVRLQRGGLEDGLVFDAVRIRLLEIGEAVKALPAGLLATEPDIPWSQIARLRDHLAHRYFDTSHSILRSTVDHDLTRARRGGPSITRALSIRESHALHGSPTLARAVVTTT